MTMKLVVRALALVAAPVLLGLAMLVPRTGLHASTALSECIFVWDDFRDEITWWFDKEGHTGLWPPEGDEWLWVETVYSEGNGYHNIFLEEGFTADHHEDTCTPGGGGSD